MAQNPYTIKTEVSDWDKRLGDVLGQVGTSKEALNNALAASKMADIDSLVNYGAAKYLKMSGVDRFLMKMFLGGSSFGDMAVKEIMKATQVPYEFYSNSPVGNDIGSIRKAVSDPKNVRTLINFFNTEMKLADKVMKDRGYK